MVRAFIAIEISDKTKGNLRNIIAKLMEVKADVKWVSPLNLHITLKFLGNIKYDEIAKISDIIKESSSDIGPFNLYIEGLGAFPDLKRPRTIFVNIKDEHNNLSILYSKLEDRLSYLGMKKESRKFIPHLTIGRARSQKYTDKLANLIETHKNDFMGKEEVDSLVLMMSELLPEGPKYTKLDTINL